MTNLVYEKMLLALVGKQILALAYFCHTVCYSSYF